MTTNTIFFYNKYTINIVSIKKYNNFLKNQVFYYFCKIIKNTEERFSLSPLALYPVGTTVIYCLS